MQKIVKITLFGFLTWFIPFIVSFFFYSKNRTLWVDEQLFKSIMIIVGSAAGAGLLVSYFKKTTGSYVQNGIVVGLAWLVINFILDFVILIPMSGLSIGAYISQIGLRYLTIPIMSISMGYILAKHESNS